ncbi:MAG: GldG family protein, partial [Myxococcales bacterium]|nr:GldG family protein [Myxococcales bacterium]
MKATPTTRRVFERVNWGASALLVLAIVAMVNWLAFRHYERWDWTSQGIYSMSDRTKKELRALKQDVAVYLFMSEAESNFPEVKELLNRYGAETTRLRVEVVDPDRDPAKYKILAQRFDVATAVDQASGQQFADVAAVVVSGDKRWSVTRDELVGVDVESMDDAAGPKVDVKAEQALTGAIVQVVSGKATKVCLTEGHGEWTSGGEGQARSLRAVETELRRDNIALENIATMGRSAIPAECDALFVVGPLRAFRDEEAKMIRDYVAHGGNALFALDPVIERESITPTGLESVLAEWGIAVDASIVLELSSDRVPPPGNAAGPYFVVD